MNPEKKKELQRLSRTFRDSVASLAISDLHMSREDKALIWGLYRSGLSSDESVEIVKKQMRLNGYVPAEDITIGQTIRLYREDVDMSQFDLAQRLGVDVSRLDTWEKDSKPLPVEFAVKLAKVFKTGYLVFIE